jgi:hypothetical protein
MEVLFEPLIERFLTVGGRVFVTPQYEIKYNKEHDEGGSCPDFLALDFDRSELLVVEITGGSSVKEFGERIVNREKRWFSPIRRQFVETGLVGKGWTIRFLGFVRGNNPDNVSKLEAQFDGASDVSFYPIESALLAHEYWETRANTGLPKGKSTRGKG